MSYQTWLLVALGGAIGATLRFGFSVFMPVGTTFPWTTLTVNLVGCFAIGVVYQYGLGRDLSSLNPFVMIGVLGGFTTFSSFGLEMVKMVQINQFTNLTVYVLLSNILGVGAVLFGIRAAKWAFPIAV